VTLLSLQSFSDEMTVSPLAKVAANGGRLDRAFVGVHRLAGQQEPAAGIGLALRNLAPNHVQ
jgi:hypothetical protein